MKQLAEDRVRRLVHALSRAEARHPCARQARRGLRLLLGALLTMLPPAPASAEPTAAGLATQSVDRLIEVHNGLSDFELPRLSSRQTEKLEEGQTVVLVESRRVIDLRDPSERKPIYRALAFRLISETREQLWLTFRDPHFLASQSLTEALLSRGPRGDRVQYQHYRLPWPFRDRQSVVRSQPALELARATENRMWELAWSALPPAGVDLSSAGIDAEATARAVWLPVNTGAWTQIAVDPGRTLVAYQLTVVPGGHIPVGLARAFAKRELNRLLSDLEDNAARVPAHYVRGHEAIVGGDGLPIAPRELAADPPASEKDT